MVLAVLATAWSQALLVVELPDVLDSARWVHALRAVWRGADGVLCQ
jgi:hypothetical protein